MSLNDIRVALRALLLGDPTISGLVGGVRIYPSKLPQGQTLASIVYNRISGIGDHHMQGASGLARPRIQIDCYAPTADAAATLALAVKNKIDGLSDAVAWDDASPGNAINIQGIFFDSERDEYDSESKMHRVSHDYFVWFEER